MELIEVEILTQAVTAQYGTLKTGDILRTDAAFAKHLVEDAFAAKYVGARPTPEKPTAEKQEVKAAPVARVAQQKPRADGPKVKSDAVASGLAGSMPESDSPKVDAVATEAVTGQPGLQLLPLEAEAEPDTEAKVEA